MNSRNTPSAYTPSNTDPALLRRIFVQRERLCEKLTDRLARSVTTGDKHHALLIGPRGCGKTNLVTLIVHDLKARPELTGSMRIAWLGEDDTFAQPIHLALAIADQLAKDYGDEFDAKPRDAARGLALSDAFNTVLQNVVTQLGDHTLIVVTENLDRTLNSFGDAGQKQWRAFMQETGRFATLATAQQLTDDVSSRERPLFGFFDVHHLEPLSVDDARDLMRKIGHEQGKERLSTYLESAEGRYRVRALHHLAGGNHRMYVLLSEFLTREALDYLIEAFEGLAEELTPYFQERLRSLPPQQATLIECLCDAARAMTVKEIAETTFVDERTCAKQLGLLKQRSYVVSQKRGKESYYDMAEPLMRLCIEVKNQRGRPLKTLARFLRAWFPAEDLETAGGHSSRAKAYLEAAIYLDHSYEESIASELESEIQRLVRLGRYEDVASCLGELQFIKPDAAKKVQANELVQAGASQLLDESILCGLKHAHEGDLAQATDEFTQVIENSNAAVDQVAIALYNRGYLKGLAGDSEQALADYARVIHLENAPTDTVAHALVNRGIKHKEAGDVEHAIADCTRVIELRACPRDQVARALLNRGSVQGQLGNVEEQLSDYTRVIEMPDAPIDQVARALVNRGATHGRSGNSEQSLVDFSRVIEMAGAPAKQIAMALINRGVAYWQLGRYAQSQRSYEEAINAPGLSLAAKTQALFALPHLIVATSGVSEVVAALKTAFHDGHRSSAIYGGEPGELLAMIMMQPPSVWEAYSTALTPLYVAHDQGPKLAYGLTQSICILDEGRCSDSAIDLWYSTWREAGADCEDLEIALKSLETAIEAIKSKSDRPLFRLPPEVRKLIRPLLKRSLGEFN